MKKDNVLFKVDNLKKYFPIRKGVFRKVIGNVKAVDDLSFYMKKGETLGMVGESGCGKSTTGRCVLRLLEPTAGSIKYQKNNKFIDLLDLDKGELNKIRKDLQIIFQDPFSSLDSRMSVRDIIAEPLKINKIGDRRKRTERVQGLMDRVGLSSYQMNRYPHEFSGGQRQRIGIARSLALDPKIVICDEPVSALDVSVQAQVLNLLSELQEELDLTYLFIAHDLSVVEHISDRVAVMYLGKIVEIADADNIYESPHHPYTEALLGSIPVGDPRSNKKRIPLKGNVADPSNPPQGCNLAPRCPYAKDKCHQEEPELVTVGNNSEHLTACYFSGELKLSGYIALKKGEKTSKSK